MFIFRSAAALLLLCLGACASGGEVGSALDGVRQANQFNRQTGLPVGVSKTQISKPVLGFVFLSRVNYSVWTDTSEPYYIPTKQADVPAGYGFAKPGQPNSCQYVDRNGRYQNC